MGGAQCNTASVHSVGESRVEHVVPKPVQCRRGDTKFEEILEQGLMLDLVESFVHIYKHHAGMQVLVCGFIQLIHSQQDCVLCGVVCSVSEWLSRKEVMFG